MCTLRGRYLVIVKYPYIKQSYQNTEYSLMQIQITWKHSDAEILGQ